MGKKCTIYMFINKWRKKKYNLLTHFFIARIIEMIFVLHLVFSKHKKKPWGRMTWFMHQSEMLLASNVKYGHVCLFCSY